MSEIHSLLAPTRALAWRLALLTLLASLCVSLAAGWTGLAVLTPDLNAEIGKNSAGVARALARQLQTAIAAGAPLDQLYAVEPLLQEMLDADSSLRGVRIDAADGRVLHHVGDAAARADVALAWGGVVVSAQPIVVDGATLGWVRVAAALGPLSNRLMTLVGVTLAALAIGGLLSGVVYYLALRRAVAAPSGALIKACQRAAQGDFTALAAPSGAAALRRAAHGFNTAIIRLNERRRRLIAHAEAIQAEGLSAEAAGRLAAVVAPIDERRRFDAAAPDRLGGKGDGALAACALGLAAAIEISRPLVGDLASDDAAASALSAVIMTAPGFAFGFAAALTLAALRALQDAPGRGVFLLGGAVAAAGALLAGWGDGALIAMLARGLNGAGLVLALAAVGPRRSEILALALGAETVGPLLGGLGADSLSPAWVASAAAAAALLFAAYGAQRLPHARPPRRAGEDWGGQFAAVAFGWVVGAVSHSLIPNLWITTDRAAAGALCGAFGVCILSGALFGHRAPRGVAAAATLFGGGVAAYGLQPSADSPLIALIGLAVLGLGAGLGVRRAGAGTLAQLGGGLALGAAAAGAAAALGQDAGLGPAPAALAAALAGVAFALIGPKSTERRP